MKAVDANIGLPWMVLAAATVILNACTVPEQASAPVEDVAPLEIAPPPPPSSRGYFKVGKPYKVAGVWYYPKVDYGYDESGVASWYGPNFDGRPTANGEIFDMRYVSAAHKTLPLPSIVRVTNLENGRSAVLRVNDRGPFVRGRIIDLSKRAAELLGFADQGTAMVRVELLAEESRRAAIELGAEGLPEFGPKAPEAAPSVAVSVEDLEPEPGMAPTGRYPGADEEPQPPVQVASADPPDDPAFDSPPPFDAMTGARGGIPDRQAGAIGVLTPWKPVTDNVTPEAAEPGAGPPLPIDVSDPVIAAPREAQVAVLDLREKSAIFIQAGAFARYDNANRLRARLSTLGPEVQISQVYVTNQPMFRVRIGPLATVAEADVTLERMIRFGYPEARIIVD